MKQKKEWNDEEIAVEAEERIKSLKQMKRKFQGLLEKAANVNDNYSANMIKTVIEDIDNNIAFYRSEIDKRRIKKPS